MGLFRPVMGQLLAVTILRIKYSTLIHSFSPFKVQGFMLKDSMEFEPRHYKWMAQKCNYISAEYLSKVNLVTERITVWNFLSTL